MFPIIMEAGTASIFI